MDHRRDWGGGEGEKTRGYLVSSQTGLGWEECGGRGRRLEGTLSPHRRDWVGRSVEGGEKTRGYLVSSQTGLGWGECGGR